MINTGRLILTLLILATSLKFAIFNGMLVASFNLKPFAFNFVLFAIIFFFVYSLFRGRKKLFIFLYLFHVVFIIGNLGYTNYFHSFLYFDVLFKNFFEATRVIADFSMYSSWSMLIAFVDLPFFIVVLQKPAVVTGKKSYYVALALLICLIGWAYKKDIDPFFIYKDTWRGQNSIVDKYGILTLQLIDYFSPKKKFVFDYGPTIDINSSNRSMNVLTIQVESLDSDVVNASYKNQQVMPFLSSLAKSSVYYPKMLSYHKGGGTTDADFCVLNSALPLLNYPAFKYDKNTYDNSIAKIFKSNGYTVKAFHNNDGRYFGRVFAYQKMGFDAFVDIADMGLPQYGWGARDGDVLDFVSQSIKQEQKPYFYHIITMSSHGPYEYVSLYHKNHDYDDIKDSYTRNYFNSMNYVDLVIGKFLSSIDLSNTIVLIYGDHSSGSIKSWLYKSSSVKVGNEYIEYVPLNIITPDKKHFVSNRCASFVDIAPTILANAGVSTKYRTYGESLVQNPNNLQNKIKWFGKDYDRVELFKAINENSVMKNFRG